MPPPFIAGDTSRRRLWLRERADPALEDDLPPEQLLLLRNMCLPCGIRAGHSSDLRELLIDPPQFVLESLELARFDRRRRCRRSRGGGTRWRLAVGADLVLDPLSIGRDCAGRLCSWRLPSESRLCRFLDSRRQGGMRPW